MTHGPAGWLAVGVPGPVALPPRTARTGVPARGSIAQDLAGVVGVAAAAGPAGYVIVGKKIEPAAAASADVWWSPDLTGWTRAHDVNDTTGSSQVLAVAADAHGFVSAGSHEGQPALWTTTDGRTWTTIVLPVPAGAPPACSSRSRSREPRGRAGPGHDRGGVDDAARRGVRRRRHARGSRRRSAHQDRTWPFTALTADAAGFTAAGLFGAPGQQDVAVWTSASGASWTPSQASGLNGAGSREITALASSGSAVTGMGSVATQASQQTVTLTLPAR